MLRLVAVFLSLALVVIVPFLIWGSDFERAFSAEAAVSWLRHYGAWAWAAGIALLVSDLILPIPATAVMTALGLVYGTLLGLSDTDLEQLRDDDVI